MSENSKQIASHSCSCILTVGVAVFFFVFYFMHQDEYKAGGKYGEPMAAAIGGRPTVPIQTPIPPVLDESPIEAEDDTAPLTLAPLPPKVGTSSPSLSPSMFLKEACNNADTLPMWYLITGLIYAAMPCLQAVTGAVVGNGDGGLGPVQYCAIMVSMLISCGAFGNFVWGNVLVWNASDNCGPLVEAGKIYLIVVYSLMGAACCCGLLGGVLGNTAD